MDVKKPMLGDKSGEFPQVFVAIHEMTYNRSEGSEMIWYGFSCGGGAFVFFGEGNKNRIIILDRFR